MPNELCQAALKPLKIVSIRFVVRKATHALLNSNYIATIELRYLDMFNEGESAADFEMLSKATASHSSVYMHTD